MKIKYFSKLFCFYNSTEINEKGSYNSIKYYFVFIFFLDKQKAEATGFSGVVERLIATIIKNVQLTVKNIHIRYEDTITNPNSPFSFGITLSELVAESTDSNWKRKIVEDIQKIYKVNGINNRSFKLQSLMS